MKTFHCQYCGNPVFFENVRCLQCTSVLAFLPDRMAVAAVEPVPQKKNHWRRRLRARRTVSRQHYRMCANSTQHQACNFAVPADDPNPLCASCRQTRVLPDLSVPANRDRWVRIEAAKRRLFYTLARLGLASPTPGTGAPDGPVYEFLADLPGQRVMTGHIDGVITLNVAEADDAERVRLRVAMHEPYRTLLGHLRHESGHFYWDRLIRDGGQLEAFRAVFGDERADYALALENHYARGGAINQWQDHHVSAYATAHPWEDWAETWAHYLHMVDLMETAASYNTRLSMPGNGGEVEEVINPLETGEPDFDALVEQWVPVTLLVNSLNRALGQEDAYPFALSAGALEKLRFVHWQIRGNNAAPQATTVAQTPPAPEKKAA